MDIDVWDLRSVLHFIREICGVVCKLFLLLILSIFAMFAPAAMLAIAAALLPFTPVRGQLKNVKFYILVHNWTSSIAQFVGKMEHTYV